MILLQKKKKKRVRVGRCNRGAGAHISCELRLQHTRICYYTIVYGELQVVLLAVTGYRLPRTRITDAILHYIGIIISPYNKYIL